MTSAQIVENRPDMIGLPRRTALVAAAATATSSALASGCILTQAVTVPAWRTMEPGAFLQRFATSGPATGAVLFPMDAAATALLGVTTYTAVTHRWAGRQNWVVATAAMAATVALLPVHFIGANAALLDPAFPPDAVPDELRSWNSWNWLRTALAVASSVAAVRGLSDMITNANHLNSTRRGVGRRLRGRSVHW